MQVLTELCLFLKDGHVKNISLSLVDLHSFRRHPYSHNSAIKIILEDAS